ncbi:hypothetical protein HCN44_004070 [Aphidius gifuensis]|uniref:Inosine/uridine-preferring nucleoside hydrolase domain-containing protein n=1 Tax=Aphidius gifuensis TaxID=684658 RepID=A0A834XYG7_APHGI|nr:probable uridine nucleosidase 2 [Aphidius gifuensis]KAF7994598.1 hypothetical protein HCN44_004070 [Aphidius gifuensis]
MEFTNIKNFFLFFFIIGLIAVTAIYCYSKPSGHQEDAESEKLLIDTDGGPDDAVAILLAISSFISRNNNTKKFDIVGITCTYGNAYLKDVEKNVLKTLTIANVTNIPVYSGAEKPLKNNFTLENYFGADGFGDFVFDKNITINIDRSKNATTALIDLAKIHSKKLTILALGPLTNIAEAIKLDPNFVGNVNKFYIMGGSISGGGNMGPNLEFNFMLDPESNKIVLDSLNGESSYLIPWEPLSQTNISTEWKQTAIDKMNTTTTEFLRLAFAKTPKNPLWIPADALAVAVIMWKTENFIEKKQAIVNSIIDKPHYGEISVNYTTKVGNIAIVTKINADEFKKLLIEKLSLFK